MKAKQAGILSTILAATCCIGPLLLVAVGMGSGAVLVGRYHWFLLLGGIAVLTWAWAKYLREKALCDCEHKPMEGRRTGMITLLIATLLVLGFAGLNISRYVFASAPVTALTQTQLANGLDRVVIPVDGLSCLACEIPVRHALRKVDGVKSVHVSAATNTATVDYEPAKTNAEQLVAVINATGFRASLPNKMNDMAKNENANDPKTDLAGESAADLTADRVSVFKVPLQCPAAPWIGCGSASKPILLDLEKQPGVSEAWLNRAGTIIAVVWKPDSDSETRRKIAADLKEDRGGEIEGKARDGAVKDFLSGKGWYRGAQVDRLSEEEASIIAARWVRRVQAKTALAKDKAEGLERAIAESLRKDLTGESARQNQKPTRLEDVAREYLDQDQIKLLSEAIDQGVRALPNEK
jgi:copper chaperone CopZ